MLLTNGMTELIKNQLIKTNWKLKLQKLITTN